MSHEINTTLPILRKAFAGESGMSFLLRSAAANGLSLKALFDFAGLKEASMPWAEHAPLLAVVMGSSVSELESRLTHRGMSLGGRVYGLQGHTLLRWKLLRISDPQVCVACVHRKGFCHALWDLRPYAVCHVHGTRLTDRCDFCGKPLTWLRPAVDICRCGHYLKVVKDEALESEAPGALILAAHIAACFDLDPEQRGDMRKNELARLGLPTWVAELSLDGVCSLVHALGRLTYAYQVGPSGAYQRYRPLFWEEICARAFARLQMWNEPQARAELTPWLWEAGLRAMAERAVTSVDQQVAMLLLKTVFEVRMEALDRRHRAPFQMSLFGE